MIEGVAAVAGVEAVSLAAVASLSTRQSIERRQRRLRWLASLRDAQGEPDPEADARRDAALLEDNRERIAAALGTIEEFGRLDDAATDTGDHGSGATITAADLARRIGEQGAISLRIQARLGAASVRRLVAPENDANAVNGL